MRSPALLALILVSACSADDLQTATNSEGLSVSAIPRGSVLKYWDAGTDLGTAWRGDFDDASWSTGAGPLGFGETYVATTVNDGPITTYFRRTFTIDDPAAITAMTAELMYDDGVVVYLNGLEIGREAMPAGTITATTQSSGHEANNTYLSFDWTHHVDVLRAGTNVLAVEVHQAGTASSDLVFDLSLTLETDEAPPPPPSGDDIARGSSWWYRDDGADLGGSWRGLEGAQPGWTAGNGPLGFGETYVATKVNKGPITTYFRREITVEDPDAVATITGELMYDDGAVVYLNGFEIARVAMPGGDVTASTQSTGHEANNSYQAFDWTGHRDRLRAGINVIAVEVHQAGTASSDLVFDLSLTVETGAPPSDGLGGFERGSDWWYWDVGGEPEPGWKTDSSGPDPWDAGFGPLGYGESYLRETIDYGPDPSNKYITSYFKESFHTDNPAAVTEMIAEVMYDDGVVVYLNGVEILRASMPSGTITPTTLSTGHEAANAYVTFDLSAHRHLLEAGRNIVAVEVHQQSASSSDLVFDMALDLRGEPSPPAPTDEDIARGSEWAYWDGVDAPSTHDAWAQPDFNDAQWARGPGPLGYGDSHVRTTISYGGDPANKTITAYFRRAFTVDAPSVETRMTLELMYDDGVVVHLNGVEILRRSMYLTTVEHDTLASEWHEGTTYEVIDLSDKVGHLRRGPNLLAVEVHQQSPSSSDLSFDASLQIETPAVCAIPGGGPAVPPLPADGVGDVWVAPGTVYATIGDTIGRRTSDGEWCWARPFPDQGWAAIWGASDDDVWFAGANGEVMRYDGAGFATVDVGTTEHLHGVWGSAADDVWIVGRRGTVRHFDGTAWQAHDLLPEQSVFAVWGAARDEVWIGGSEPAPYPGNPEYDGSSAIVYRWVPATGTWELVFENTMYYGSAGVAALSGTSANDIWAIGWDHPAGAACTISGLWHFDGESWHGIDGSPTECFDMNDVTAGAPGAPDGAWVVGSPEPGRGEHGAWRYTGGIWDVVASPTGFTAIDDRDDRLFAGGWSFEPRRSHYLLRWDDSAFTFVQEW